MPAAFAVCPPNRERNDQVEIGCTRLLESTTSLSYTILIVATIDRASHIASDSIPSIAHLTHIHRSSQFDRIEHPRILAAADVERTATHRSQCRAPQAQSDHRSCAAVSGKEKLQSLQ